MKTARNLSTVYRTNTDGTISGNNTLSPLLHQPFNIPPPSLGFSRLIFAVHVVDGLLSFLRTVGLRVAGGNSVGWSFAFDLRNAGEVLGTFLFLGILVTGCERRGTGSAELRHVERAFYTSVSLITLVARGGRSRGGSPFDLRNIKQILRPDLSVGDFPSDIRDRLLTSNLVAGYLHPQIIDLRTLECIGRRDSGNQVLKVFVLPPHVGVLSSIKSQQAPVLEGSPGYNVPHFYPKSLLYGELREMLPWCYQKLRRRCGREGREEVITAALI
ncbi:unnamed protein product [Tuber aestivum]|uniref:Uncharacterized protein n=1 Tax=Tuber aestivum TaxID=59557 RepID=A0A292Q295_9PEZI|nr:unnamed protein product [Tuber aestivum]